MWKDYTAGYIRHNKAASISIMAAAFISALFLSLLCSLFYNLWQYEVEQIILKEGDWQGRIVAEISDDEIDGINYFANVSETVINEALSGEEKRVIDIYFKNTRTIYNDLPLIAESLGLEKDAVFYHELLLSRYMIHDPEDEQPPMLMAFYLFILAIVSLSLILIIRNSFAMSMNARIHQFGIFSSIGAAPRQIRHCLLQEAAVLCCVPVLMGGVTGILCGFGIIQGINVVAADIPGRHRAVFQYHPLIFIITILAAILTVFFSAWFPARKLSRLTPLEAMRNAESSGLKKEKNSRFLSLLFGIEGELAGSALKAQKRALRTSALSLTLSFLGFTIMLCFFTLSDISTDHTYFERYQDVWDVMVTVKDTPIENFGEMDKLRAIDGTDSVISYQKVAACADVSRDGSSEKRVDTLIVVMDDMGFEEYCGQINVEPGFEGVIILNRIWDRENSNFRYKEYVPYMKEDKNSIILWSADTKKNYAEVPILAYTQEVPILREEYDDDVLVQFMPLSLWKELSAKIGGAEQDICIRILSGEDVTLPGLNEVEKDVLRIIGQDYKIESENRIQEKLTNDQMISGYKLIIGAFCGLLALIGIANVFSNTLGFMRQRKREFARYMSIGLTPAGIRKMFAIEALVIAGRPLLITLPLTVVFVVFAVTASCLDPMEFLGKMPIVPVMIFIFIIFFFVGLAYYLGGRKNCRSNLGEILKDDTL